MKSDLNIPKEIVVGYQNREDTYSGKLGYIVYKKGSKGEIAKKASWEHWRDKNIAPGVFENTPMMGFYLNKMIGGHGGGWNSRRSMCRIYDPRGFEFEITTENLLFILQHAVCNLGELKGEFVYSWDGKDLVLLPCKCQDYIDSVNTINKTVKILPSALEISAGYKTKHGDLYYIGKLPWYSESPDASRTRKCKGNYHTFVDPTGYFRGYINPTSMLYYKMEEGISPEKTYQLKEIFTEETYYGAADEKLLGIVSKKSSDPKDVVDKDDLLSAIENYLTSGINIPDQYQRICLVETVTDFADITETIYEIRRVNDKNETEHMFRSRIYNELIINKKLTWNEARIAANTEVSTYFNANTTLKYLKTNFNLRHFVYNHANKSVQNLGEKDGPYDYTIVNWDSFIEKLKSKKVAVYSYFRGVNILLESGKEVSTGYFGSNPIVLCEEISTLLGIE